MKLTKAQLKLFKTAFCIWALNHPMSPDNEWFVCNCLGDIISWVENPFDWVKVIKKFNTDTEEETEIDKIIKLAKERQRKDWEDREGSRTIPSETVREVIRRSGVAIRKATGQKVRAVLETRKASVRPPHKPKKKKR